MSSIQINAIFENKKRIIKELEIAYHDVFVEVPVIVTPIVIKEKIAKEFEHQELIINQNKI